MNIALPIDTEIARIADPMRRPRGREGTVGGSPGADFRRKELDIRNASPFMSIEAFWKVEAQMPTSSTFTSESTCW